MRQIRPAAAMKSHILQSTSPWRRVLPLVQKIRRGYGRFTERICHRLIISGGRIRFLDVELNFPEGVAVLYSTRLFWEGPEAYELANSRTIALLASRSRVFLISVRIWGCMRSMWGQPARKP